MPEAKTARPPIAFNRRRFLIFVLIAIVLFLFVSGVLSIVGVWNVVLLKPMLNFLILLSKGFLHNFGLAVIVLTIIVRVLMFPFTMRQLRASRAMQQIQPKVKELQKKYAKDQQKLGQETMKLYKELGYNPLGCVLPMLIQFPIWIALYQAVIQALAYTPENLLGLSKNLYHWSAIQEAVPLNHHFLWLDLARGDFFVAILVAASMWFLQKMSTQPALDPQQQSTNRIMLWLMPLMFGFFALTLPSGLSVYWISSNIISMVLQYRVTGWGTLSVPSLPFLRKKTPLPADAPENAGEASGRGEKAGTGSAGTERKEAAGGDISSQRKKDRHGKHRGKRKN